MISPAPIIDSHHHLWRVDVAADARPRWPTLADGALYRDFRWSELAPQLDAANVHRTILVQSDDSDAHTDFLLDQAARHKRIAGVVGWLRLDDPAATDQRLDELSGRRAFVGVRCQIHRLADNDWLARPDVDRSFGILERAGMPFDVVSDQPSQLRHVAAVAHRHPDLPLVIDHLSKPPIGIAPEGTAWHRELVRAAAQPNTYAKLSGLYPQTDRSSGSLANAIRPYVDVALGLFGPRRLMLGSDWPVCLVAGGYAIVWSALLELVGELSADEQGAVLGGTATRVYRIPEVDGDRGTS